MSDVIAMEPKMFNGAFANVSSEVLTTYSMYYGRCFTVVSQKEVKV